MSGSMQPPMQQQPGPAPMAGGPPMGGGQGPMAQPGGGQPQIPPQVLQMLMQRMQQGGGGGAPQGGPPMQPPGAGQGPMPPQAAGGAPPPGGPPGYPPPQVQPPGQQPMTPAQMAQKGRFGDQVVAHLTPGEVQVPPQVQTPQLMEQLQKAFAQAGVSPQQFTAGSPQSSHNPATGAPEYSLLAALLPILGGAAGSFLLPGLGTGVGAAIGGGLGGAAGGLMDHAGGMGTALSALGGGLGGYVGGGGLGGSGAAGALQGPTASGATLQEATTPFGSGASNYASFVKPGLGAGLGSTVGGMLAPPSSSGNSTPPSFGGPLPPLNKNFNSLLGNNNSSTFSTQGYNPYQAATGNSYNFYSPTGNGA